MAKGKPKLYSLTWRGTLIEIKHTPKYFDYADHVEVRVKKPAKAIIPITETGYKSYFVDPEELATNGGPLLFIQAELEREASTKAWRKREQQLSQLSFLDLLISKPKPRATKKRTA